MTIPTKTREYRVEKIDPNFDYFSLKEASLAPPKRTEVLLKVHAVSLQSRDLQIAQGSYGGGVTAGYVPASDMAGEIVAVGEDVKKWKIGDRVSPNFALDHIAGETNSEIQKTALGKHPVDGVLTEYIIVPAHSLVRIPAYMSYEEASTLPCAALTAYNALQGPTPVKGGDVVLVEGTGGVAIFGLQLAAAAGAIVIATSSSDKKLQQAKELGAKHVINYKTTPEWETEVLKLTDGRGVDHVLEVGGSATLKQAMSCTRICGWLHMIGYNKATGRKGGDIDELVLLTIARNLHLRGIQIGSRVLFEDMIRFLESAQIKPVIDKVFSFEETQEAFRYLDSATHVGKVVIKVSKN